MQNIILIMLLLLLNMSISAQQITLFGRIADSGGSPLPYATVYDNTSKRGTVANAEGFYSISYPAGHHQLHVSFVGYKPYEIQFNQQQDSMLNINLQSRILEAVNVVADDEPIHRQTLMGKSTLSGKKVEQLVAFGGEPDILRALSSLPGFNSAREGYSQLIVRGGNRDQNLIRIDGMPLYNTSRALGFMSGINPAIMESVDVYKSGFPAEFGDKVSSVIDIHTRDGSTAEKKSMFELGLLKSALRLERPIGRHSSMFVAARASYHELLTLPQTIKYLKGERSEWDNIADFYLGDINLKFKSQLGKHTKLSLSVIGISDYFWSVDQQFYQNGDRHIWKYKDIKTNMGGIFNWEQTLSPRLFMKTAVSHSQLQHLSSVSKTEKEIYEIQVHETQTSRLTNSFIQTKFNWYPDATHSISAGVKVEQFYSQPGILQVQKQEINNSTDTVFGLNSVMKARQLSVFVQDEIRFSETLRLNGGLRYSYFTTPTDNHQFLEPRISLRYLLSDLYSVKASYTQMHQYMQTLQRNSDEFGLTLWIMPTQSIKPISAGQWSAGIFGQLPGLNIELSLELYYKTMNNLVAYNYLNAENALRIGWEDIIEKNGTGTAYGLETQMTWRYANHHLQLTYVLAHSNRQFSGLNNGKTFTADYDKLHDLNLVYALNWKAKHRINAQFSLHSGFPASLPDALIVMTEFFNGYESYSKINNYRMPLYHRLDFAYTRKWKSKRGRIHHYSIDIYNVYAKQNPVKLFVENNRIKQVTHFVVIPGFNYGITF